MERIKFIKLLQKLDRNTVLDFEKFLNSSYFLKRKDLPKLFDAVKRYHPAFDSKNFTKKNLFKKAFPEKSYSDALLRKYFSELYRMLILYFPISTFNEENIKSYRRVAEVNFFYGNVDEAEKRITSTIKKYKTQKTRDLHYHYDMFMNEQLLFCIYQKKENIKNDLLLNTMIEHFTKFSIMSLLRLYTITNNHRLDKPHYTTILKKIIEISETDELKNDPVIAINYCSFKVTSEPDNHNNYYELKKLVFKNKSLLSGVVLTDVFQLMNNYCNIKIDSGILEFYREKFELHERIVKKEFLIKKIISVNFFTTTVINALLMNELKWAEKFIDEYKDHLYGDTTENRMYYVQAYLELYKNNYSKALDLISKINFSDHREKIKVKILNMMIHYENKAYESLLYLADTFKHYIFKYKSIPQETRETANNFINTMMHLAKHKLSNSKKSSANIIIKKPASNYIWLHNKIQEL